MKYSAICQASVTAAKTLIELKTPSDRVVMIQEAWVEQETSEVSDQVAVRLVRATATGTGTAYTPEKLNPGNPASVCTVKVNMTAEPTGKSTNGVVRRGFNLLNGMLWAPTPNEMIVVAGNAFLLLELMVAPASATVIVAGLIWEEF